MKKTFKKQEEKTKSTKTKIILCVMLLSLIVAVPMLVGAKNNRAGKSNITHLYLYEKDANWDIVEDGSWAKMKYNISGSELKFVFNAHQLAVGQDYTLVYYPDPWPGEGLICLGSGIVNEEGNLHLQGAVDTGDLPAENDENDGAKIWLVLSADVDCDEAKMTGWDASAYLFENNLITFDDTDE